MGATSGSWGFQSVTPTLLAFPLIVGVSQRSEHHIPSSCFIHVLLQKNRVRQKQDFLAMGNLLFAI